MRPVVQELKGIEPYQAFSAFAGRPYSILFDSADPAHPASRHSFIAVEPEEIIEHKAGVTAIINAKGRKIVAGQNPFAVLQARLNRHAQSNAETIEELPPFQGGAAGLFGYDLGRTLEDLPSHAVPQPHIPDMAVGIYNHVFAYDHEQAKGWLIGRGEDAGNRQAGLLKTMRAARLPPAFKPLMLDWEANFDAFSYIQEIQRVIEYIKAGDIFQANIAQRFEAALPEALDPFAHYLHMRNMNAAPFSAFMNTGDIQISSASPERFLSTAHGRVETWPIKGTRPRHDDPSLNDMIKAELQSSEKDRAENIMIVDLMRNDLSKVCTADSVDVSALCRLESFARVHHLVSCVEGRLKDNHTPVDLLKACFPGGSITGAPKIRAMEIIDEIEPLRRGPYCGSLAYIGFDGTMDSSILIRTLVYEKDKISFQTGGGIVADSCPDQEYQETFDKADAIFRSFEDDYEIEEEYLALTAGSF